MSKVITFSRTFPGYHPRKGQPTHFVEMTLNQLQPRWQDRDYIQVLLALNDEKIMAGKLTHDDIGEFHYSLNKNVSSFKRHTIRSGHRWKAGDKFSPRVWSGRPYHSPQIIFAPDVELKKVWDFTIKEINGRVRIWIENKMIFEEDEFIFFDMEKMARNDGLNLNDFLHWFKFPKPFDGQVIAWDEGIRY